MVLPYPALRRVSSPSGRRGDRTLQRGRPHRAHEPAGRGNHPRPGEGVQCPTECGPQILWYLRLATIRAIPEDNHLEKYLLSHPFLNAPSASSCMSVRAPAANVGPPPGTAADSMASRSSRLVAP